MHIIAFMRRFPFSVCCRRYCWVSACCFVVLLLSAHFSHLCLFSQCYLVLVTLSLRRALEMSLATKVHPCSHTRCCHNRLPVLCSLFASFSVEPFVFARRHDDFD